jgi:hypothetical protein
MDLKMSNNHEISKRPFLVIEMDCEGLFPSFRAKRANKSGLTGILLDSQNIKNIVIF